MDRKSIGGFAEIAFCGFYTIAINVFKFVIHVIDILHIDFFDRDTFFLLFFLVITILIVVISVVLFEFLPLTYIDYILVIHLDKIVGIL